MLQKLYAYIAIFFSMLFWGMSFIWTKDLLNAGFTPIIIITLRLVISAILLYVVFKLSGKLDKIEKKDYKLFMLLAFFEPFLYFFGENWGLKYVDASLGSIIISTIPVFVPFMLFFFHKEQLRWQILIGVFLTIIGLGIMSISSDLTFNVSGKGIAFMFLAVFSAAGYSVVLFKVIQKYEAITITTTQNIIGAIYYLPLFFVFEYKNISKLNFDIETLYPLFALAILCSSVAFICYSYSAKRLTITKTTVFTNAVPIVTIIFVVILGKEILTISKILGIIIVILGVFLSQIDFKRKKLNKHIS
ncbi:MAG: DMT family transporter [Bacteroidales bacterium]|jgi:drug/metabolite transporter (DMT)-like permease|nr:DMT family transporter [Bacteroidales bacterium]MDD4528846.1 DMT family transporter [Bacteroidales bacterium]MDD4829101.1 DMT family transporter [Bacteroidales bacterium]